MEDYRAYAKHLKRELLEERKRADDRQAEIVVLYIVLAAILILFALSHA